MKDACSRKVEEKLKDVIYKILVKVRSREVGGNMIDV